MKRKKALLTAGVFAALLALLAILPEDLEAAGCGGCTITVTNRSRAALHVWVDGIYQGFLCPGARGVTFGLSLGNHTLHLRGIKGCGNVSVFFTRCVRHYYHFYGP